MPFSRCSPNFQSLNHMLIIIPICRCSPPASKPRRPLNPLCKLIPLRKAERLAKNPATRLSTHATWYHANITPKRMSPRFCYILGFPITYFGQISKYRTTSTRKELVSQFSSCLGLSGFCYTSCFFTSFLLSHLSCFLTFWLRQLMHACICTTPIIFLPVSLYLFSSLCACPGNEKRMGLVI
jgi:hypothetical protein